MIHKMKKNKKGESSSKYSGETIKKNDSSYRGPASTLSMSGASEEKSSFGGEKVSAQTKQGKETNSQLGTASYAGPGRHL